MSTKEFNLATATQRDVVARIMSVKTELQAIESKGDAITEEDITQGEALAAELKQLKAKNDVFGKAKGFGEVTRTMDEYLAKPVGGMVHPGAAAAKTNDKGVEIGESISGIATKSQPWAIFGDKGGFFHSVKGFFGSSPDQDSREKIAAWQEMQTKITPAGLYEGSDPDGGVLVPSETSNNIYTRALQLENLWTKIDNMPVKGNTMTYPKLNDKSRQDGQRDGGVQGFWEGEGEALSAVKPQYGLDSLRLKKLAVLIYATDELLNDSPFALGNFLTERAAAEIAFKLNYGLLRGTGNGMPLGIINATCLLTIPAVTGQATKTVVTQNVNDMYMRLWAPYRKDAVWMINQDVESTLQSMGLPVGIAGQPTYLPPGGLSGVPYATLKGLPVLIVEQCSTLGSVGDILLGCWSQYRGISKGGIDSAMSMHVRFLTGEQTFRFLFRADGQPKWGEPLTPYQGTTTYSPFVALAGR